MLKLLNRNQYLKIPGIYCIKSTIDGRVYIGSTANLYSRSSGHICSLKNNRHPNKLLQHFFNKHGACRLEFIVIERCEIDKLEEREVYFTTVYNSIKTGFNIGVPYRQMLGLKWSDATRAKVISKFELNKETIIPKLLVNLIKARESLVRLKASGEYSPRTTKGYITPDHVKKKQSLRKIGRYMNDESFKAIPIIQYSLEGVKIKEWYSAHQAAVEMGFHETNIRKVCIGERVKAHGYMWKFKNPAGKLKKLTNMEMMVYRLLTPFKKPLTVTQMVNLIKLKHNRNLSISSVSIHLKNLYNLGLIVKTGIGSYKILMKEQFVMLIL